MEKSGNLPHTCWVINQTAAKQNTKTSMAVKAREQEQIRSYMHLSLMLYHIYNGGSRIYPRRGPVNSNFKEKSTAAIFFYIEMLRPRGGGGVESAYMYTIAYSD